MNTSDFSGKRILVMGLGRHGGGASAARFFTKAGAAVTVTDSAPQETLKASLDTLRGLPIRFVLGEHREEDFKKSDLIIQNPAVPTDSPYLSLARQAGVPVDSDVGIFFRLVHVPIIGITGTKGKSTATALTGQIFKTQSPSVIVAGNIRTPVLDVVHAVVEESIIILELSSWQLEMLARNRQSPKTAVLTRIFHDHLNRYRDFASYVEAKKNIIRYQQSDDAAILCADDPIERAWERDIPGRVLWYGKEPQDAGVNLAVYVHDGKIMTRETKEPLVSLTEIPLRAEHMLTNILAAAACAVSYNMPFENIRKALRTFHGLPGRLETIAHANGVEYINDTTATTPDATIAALRYFHALGKKIHLIAGGTDKNLDYRALGEAIRSMSVQSLEFLPGSATEKIKRALGGSFQAREAHSMEEAVAFASSNARAGDVVLLSPGAASFGLFLHEYERGDAFLAAVHARLSL